MTHDNTQPVTITAAPEHRDGTRLVIAIAGTEELRRDQINTNREQARQRYARVLAEQLGQPGRAAEFAQAILQAADQADRIEQECGDAAMANDCRDRKSQVTVLVDLASDAQLFHTPELQAYATVRVGDHLENWALGSREFSAWLLHRFFEQRDGAPGAAALRDAIATLEARALFGGTSFMYISYVIPTTLGLFAFGRSWKQMGPWDLGGPAYRVLSVLSIVGCGLILVIGVQPPNDRNLWIVLSAFGLTALVWFGYERSHFRGPPQGVLDRAHVPPAAVAEPVAVETT